MIWEPLNRVQTRVYCVVSAEDWSRLGMGLIRSRFSVTPLYAHVWVGGQIMGWSGWMAAIQWLHLFPVLPVWETFSLLRSQWQHSSHGSGYPAQSEAPQHSAGILSQEGEAHWFRHKSTMVSKWEENKSETEQLRFSFSCFFLYWIQDKTILEGRSLNLNSVTNFLVAQD